MTLINITLILFAIYMTMGLLLLVIMLSVMIYIIYEINWKHIIPTKLKEKKCLKTNIQ